MTNFNIQSFLRIAIISVCFLLISNTDSSAQNRRFKGGVVIGMNAAQIDGDNLYGYNQLGLTGGFKLLYPMKKNIDYGLELLFSQRGSNAGFGFGNDDFAYTSLNYLEIPLYLTIKDWYFEDEKYHKVSAHAGMSLGYLYDIDTNDGVWTTIDQFRTFDFSYLVGVNFALNRNVSFTLRYTRSFGSLHQTQNAVGYFLTLRSEYMF